LNWYSNCSTTEYKTLLDAQKIESGRIHSMFVEFKNKSSDIAKKVVLTKDAADSLQIHPSAFTLKPTQSVKVEITLTPQRAGVYHHKIVV
jgi:hypothetical protein